MKVIKIGLVIVGVFITCGCAIFPSSSDQTPTEQAHRIVQASLPIIRTATALATTLSLQYANERESDGEILKTKIHTISNQLIALISAKDFSPNSVTEALKIKEAYVDEILGTVASLYKGTYDKLESIGEAKMAIEILNSVLEGISDATN
jgi:hypothetical protein